MRLQQGAAGLAAFALACAAAGTAPAAGAGWSSTTQLVPVSVQTFSPALAVNGGGAAVAAWFSGPAPVVTAGSGRAVARRPWAGNSIDVSVGSVARGLARPVTVARDGNDEEGGLKVAVSGSGTVFVLWDSVHGSGWTIVTGRGGRFARPRHLALPRAAGVWRFTYGLYGPVDVIWHLGSRFRCTRVHDDGTLGASFVPRHPFKPNPCGLPPTGGMIGAAPPSLTTPPGYEIGSRVVSVGDGHGDSIAVWDDRPVAGGYTYGLFYAMFTAF